MSETHFGISFTPRQAELLRSITDPLGNNNGRFDANNYEEASLFKSFFDENNDNDLSEQEIVNGRAFLDRLNIDHLEVDGNTTLPFDVKNAWDMLPEEIRNDLTSRDNFRFELTDSILEARPELESRTPRGAPDGFTFNQVPGLVDTDGTVLLSETVAYRNASSPVHRTSEDNIATALHEIGHVVYDFTIIDETLPDNSLFGLIFGEQSTGRTPQGDSYVEAYSQDLAGIYERGSSEDSDIIRVPENLFHYVQGDGTPESPSLVGLDEAFAEGFSQQFYPNNGQYIDNFPHVMDFFRDLY